MRTERVLRFVWPPRWRSRILRLAEAVEQGVPGLELDMGRVSCRPHPQHPVVSCCLMGYTCVVLGRWSPRDLDHGGSYPSELARVRRIMRASRHFLGLSSAEARELFFAYPRGLRSPAAAAAALRQLAATGAAWSPRGVSV